MFIDWTYIVLVLPAVIFAMICSAHVQSTFKKYSSVPTASGMTGAQAAQAVLDANGVTGVRIEHVPGNLTDHYDPRSNVIRLSDNVINGTSAAAVGVAAHEAGHAVQHAVGYFPIKIRNAIIPITNLGSKLAIPLFLIGLVLTYYGQQYVWIAYAGLICYAACLLFQLVTLPTEFNASSRALAAIRSSGRFDAQEVSASKKVLSAAAMTYVASLAVTLMTLLRLLVLLSGARGRRN